MIKQGADPSNPINRISTHTLRQKKVLLGKKNIKDVLDGNIDSHGYKIMKTRGSYLLIDSPLFNRKSYL